MKMASRVAEMLSVVVAVFCPERAKGIDAY